MSDVDCLATLGDPWPNLDRVFNVVSYLGLQQTHDDRVRAECRAELEQAHGRIRPVHRKRPGRALHIGNVLPSGTGWSGTIIERQLGVGRPRSMEAMPGNELRELIERLGGVQKAAELVGCHRTTLGNFLLGKRSISAPMAQLLRALASQPETKGSNSK
jgi:hypothetical protein